MRTDQAASHLQLSLSRFKHMVAEGHVPVHRGKTGRTLLFSRRELDQWVLDGRPLNAGSKAQAEEVKVTPPRKRRTRPKPAAEPATTA